MHEIRKLAKLLRALVALTQNQTLVRSDQMVCNNLSHQFQGFQCPLLTSKNTKHAHSAHTFMQAKYSYK